MRRVTFFHVLLLAALVPGLVPVLIPDPAFAQGVPIADWRGLYFGYHTGAALGLVDVGDPFGPSIFGDTVRTPGLLVGGQAGYNWQSGVTVYGLEADASWADMDGTNTCFAFSGLYVSFNCQTHIDALGTLTGRLGWLVPSDERTMLYAKGGLAWEYATIDATPNGGFGLPGTGSSGVQWGWTLGAGAERALARGWSLKAEYDLLSFDGNDIAAAEACSRRRRRSAIRCPSRAPARARRRTSISSRSG